MSRDIRVLLAAAAILLVAQPALADPATDPAAGAGAPFAGAVSVNDRDLDSIAGKAELNMAIVARNSSEVSNNSVVGNSVTGTISFDGSAFADMNGLSVLSANTGNNVAINASLNVNVAINP